MWWHCTCIVGRVRPSSLMRIKNKSLTVGVRTPPGARNFGSFWRHGSGICASHWGTRSIPQPCAPRNLLLQRRSGCPFRRASTRLDASTAGSIWIGAMGTSFVYGRLSRFSFSPTTRWNAALPRRSSPLSTRTPTRTRRLAAGGVCRTSRSLSSMRAARAVSSIGNHPQSSAEKSRCLGLSLPVHRSQRRPHLQQVNLCLQWVLIQCVLRDWQRRFHRREVVKLLAQKPR